MRGAEDALGRRESPGRIYLAAISGDNGESLPYNPRLTTLTVMPESSHGGHSAKPIYGWRQP